MINIPADVKNLLYTMSAFVRKYTHKSHMRK